VNQLLDLEGALAALARGGVVGVPTDTVYGLAASLERRGAIDALFMLKHRPASLALPVLVHSVVQIEGLGVTWGDEAQSLSEAFWPGALTVVVTVPDAFSALLGSTNGTVGFRRPEGELVNELLALSGPLAVTSANEHGAPPCSSANEVIEVFGERHGFAGVLDGGPCTGSASTVVDISGTGWQLLREGGVDRAALTFVLGVTR
jgi:tRNA threonylcarbamoyl adenosine modification protein (Sua5/YciO/YrdC/YwlC family)